MHDGQRAAPSFLDLATRDERVICVNSFSKAWLMTGWRLGWIVAPAALMDDLGKLVEYNTSCAPSFVQQAGIVAVEQGERFTQALVADLKASRDHLVRRAVTPMPGIDVQGAAGRDVPVFLAAGRRRAASSCARRSCAKSGLGRCARQRVRRRRAKASCAGATHATRRGSTPAWASAAFLASRRASWLKGVEKARPAPCPTARREPVAPAGCFTFTHRFFLRNMALSHAIPP